MTELAQQTCKPCELGATPLKGEALTEYWDQLSGEWQVLEEHHLIRSYSFGNFKEALDFTNKVGELAEAEGHHPDIFLAWGKVDLTLFTHKIDGLSEADFVFAAKVDKLNG